jgi:hypothetical protein
LADQFFTLTSFFRPSLATQVQATAFIVFGPFFATALFATVAYWGHIPLVFHQLTQLLCLHHHRPTH